MDTVLGIKEEKPALHPQPKKVSSGELGGLVFAAILAVCYEFLSWLQSLRTVRD